MKHLSPIIFAALAIGGNAVADNEFQIESEAQFEQQYSGQAEKIAPGVYLIVDGPSTGKTASIGRSGLEYDLSIQRARVADAILAGTPDPYAAQSVLQLEEALSRYAELDQLMGNGTKQSPPVYHIFNCISHIYTSTSENTEDPAAWTTVFYYATATLGADVEFYVDNGGGGWNHYYARAIAAGNGIVRRPVNLPSYLGGLRMTAYAKNKRTGVTAYESLGTSIGSWVSTGYVTDFNWTHSLIAETTAMGYGDCFGYASVSDTEPTY